VGHPSGLERMEVAAVSVRSVLDAAYAAGTRACRRGELLQPPGLYSIAAAQEWRRGWQDERRRQLAAVGGKNIGTRA